MAGKSIDYGHLAFEVIDRFEGLSSCPEVIGHMSKTLSAFGYTAFLVATAPELIGDAQPDFLLNGWPPAWTEHYTRENFYPDDPVIVHLRRTVDPFQWSEVPASLRAVRRSKQIKHDAAQFGLREGFCVPVFQNGGVIAGVTMGGRQPEFDPHAKRAIHLISLYAHAKALSLAHPSRPARHVLSKGERETLRWVAAGKSSWDISVILKVSEATVNWRIKKATEKLEAINRTQAVVKAIRAKEINI